MISTTITEKQALAGFFSGTSCAMAVFAEFAPQLGLDKEAALKIASSFGSGMMCAGVCGCVSGAYMAIGLACGGDQEKRSAAIAAFRERFEARFGSTICREMLPNNVCIPEEKKKAVQDGDFERICAKAVVFACHTVCEVLNG